MKYDIDLTISRCERKLAFLYGLIVKGEYRQCIEKCNEEIKENQICSKNIKKYLLWHLYIIKGRCHKLLEEKKAARNNFKYAIIHSNTNYHRLKASYFFIAC